MAVLRWVFQDVDSGERYTVEINPNQMSGYHLEKSFDWASHAGGRMRGVKADATPKEYSFGGVVRRKSHHDALVGWQKHPGKVRVYDHLGRTFEVMIKSLDMTDRRPVGDDTWRFQYTFNCLLLRRLT